MEEQIAFPLEKIKMLTEEEQRLLEDFKKKEKEANSASLKMYYTGQIHAVYKLADMIYKERLELYSLKKKINK